MNYNLQHPILMNHSLNDAQCIQLRIKFCLIDESEREYFIHLFVNDFLIQYEEHSLLCIQDDDEKNIKFKNVEQHLMDNKTECSIMGGMIVKKGLDPKINSYAKAEKQFSEKLQLFSEEEEFFSKNPAGFLPRKSFADDESFINHARKCIQKDISIKTRLGYEDLIFHIRFTNVGGSLFNGEFDIICSGYTMDYYYSDMLGFWKSFVFNVSERVKNMLAYITLIKSPDVLLGDYIDVIREGVLNKYDNKEPWEIFLLDNIGWFNYLPNMIIKEHFANKIDQRVAIHNKRNGVCISLKKDIKDLTTEDIIYLRKNYLDQYLLKGRCILDEDVDEYSVIRNAGEILPIYEEEISLIKTTECGRILYGIQFVPLD